MKNYVLKRLNQTLLCRVESEKCNDRDPLLAIQLSTTLLTANYTSTLNFFIANIRKLVIMSHYSSPIATKSLFNSIFLVSGDEMCCASLTFFLLWFLCTVRFFRPKGFKPPFCGCACTMPMHLLLLTMHLRVSQPILSISRSRRPVAIAQLPPPLLKTDKKKIKIEFSSLMPNKRHEQKISEDYFSKITSLSWLYPTNVFAGKCLE